MENNLDTPLIVNDITPDPFSNRKEDRQKWLDDLEIPNLYFEQGKDKIGKEIGRGDNGKVFVLDRGVSQSAVKMIRKNDPQEVVRREYAGLLLAHQLFPENFPKPLGALIDRRGNVIGLEMQLVSGKKQIMSFFDKEEYEQSGKIKTKEGQQRPPDAFFNKLREIINTLGKNNLWLNDINGGKILVDEEWNPTIVDVQYYCRSMRDWEPDAAQGTIDEIQSVFNGETIETRS